MVWSGYAVLMSGKTDSIKLNNNPGCLPGSTFVYNEVFKLDFSSASPFTWCASPFILRPFSEKYLDDTEDDEGNDDGDDSDGNDDDNDGDDNDGDDEHEEEEEEENVDEFTDKEDDANNANEENKEELDDGEELYKDVNVNLRKEDVEMTDVDQSGADQHNVSQESGFEQEEEDAHVILTAVYDIQKTESPMQSSSVSSDFTKKLLNFENISLADNKIASLMDTTVRHEEPSGQTSTLFTIPIIVIPITIPLPPNFFNPLPQQTTPSLTPTASEVTTSFPALPDFSFVFKFNDRVTKLETNLSEMKQVAQEEAKAKKHEYIHLVDTSVRTIIREEFKTQLPQILPKVVSDFATTVIERNVTESLEVVVLANVLRSSIQTDYKRKLYDALVESYNTDKDLFETYGEVFTLKRSQNEKDKDQDPSARSDRGTKRRKSSKEAKIQKDPKSKEGKSSSSSKDTSQSHYKSSGKTAHAEEPSHTVDDSRVQNNQEFDMSNNDEQPKDEAAPKNDCVTTRAEKPPTSFDELTDTPIDFFAFLMNRLNITNLTQELLVGLAFNLLKGTCKSLIELEYHFEEYNQGRQFIPQDYFINNDLEYLKGGSLSRQYSTFVTKTKAATYEIKWIEDMVPNQWSLVKVVYDKHAYWGTSNWGVNHQRFYGFACSRESTKDVYSRKRIIAVTRLNIMKRYDYGHLDEIEVHERYDLNVALRMFTRRIVIQRRVEDLQLGVKSYQKKLNIIKSDTFSDGTLNYYQTALHDITSGIRMEYLPKWKWSELDKRRARVMIQDIDK
ncbi:hypothetical protein Tco_0687268 [Tanacetum coccineum]